MRMQSFLKKILLALALVSVSASAAPDFLPPEKAFRVEATWLENSNEIEIEFHPAKGYYIYQESLKFQAGSQTGKLGSIKPYCHWVLRNLMKLFRRNCKFINNPLWCS